MCKEELMNKEHISSVEAENRLKGKLENKKIYKFSHRGIEFPICHEHLSILSKETEEEIKKEEPIKENIPDTITTNRKKPIKKR